ncbi:phage gp6-like head-tail connector protein [Streptomyces sp. NBC_00525]|uniref:phage gp6-like head-tail connector protein n=1 Tax=Streptomyces sp. NBC_00525 TaxID=2903660 RepID=UPI002E80F77D|nr:phage gp6-like head-tail connector protein [Streptomyces sp. NBC_00525]WUC97414.1 phage head-tail connector protein [Streptomyces sp. NBC_00525]
MGYVDLTDVKAAAGMASDDDTRDALLTTAINAATKLIDNETGRTFTLDAAASARVFVPSFGDLLIIDDVGAAAGVVVEVGSVGSTSWSELDSSAYELHPLNALAKGKPVTGLAAPASAGWGSRTRVRVTARWGWPAVPDEVVQACMIQAVRLFKRKDSPEGIMGSDQWGLARLSRVDPDVQALIAHLALPGF